MGCVGSNSKKEPVKEPAKDTNPAGPGPSKEPSGISDPRNGSNIRASKLTEEQVIKKRAEMRANLEEGHSKPPPVYIPHFEPISHIEE